MSRLIGKPPDSGSGDCRFESYLLSQWSHRLAVRTPASHVVNTGSIPVGTTNLTSLIHRLRGLTIYSMKLPAPRGGVSFRIICKTLDSTRQTKSAQVEPTPRVILRPQAEESPAKRDPSLCSG